MLEFIRNRVKINPDSYDVFVKALQKDAQYRDILMILGEKCPQPTGSPAAAATSIGEKPEPKSGPAAATSLCKTRSKLQKDVNQFFQENYETDEHMPFMEFNHEHSKQLSDVLQQLSTASKDDIMPALSLAKIFVKNKVNPTLVKMALGIFLTHSEIAQRLGVIAPSLDHHSKVLKDKKTPLSNPVSADTMNGVSILAYFREDYDFNDHHWHWHLVYPYTGIPNLNQGFRRVIDRQGELFLYMHSQMIARYNAELLSWDLDMTHAWGYDDILTFGYTPVPGIREKYGARPPFQGWYENHNPSLPDGDAPAPKKMLIKCRNNIFEAIEEGHFITKKRNGDPGKLKLTENNSMNWVGIVVEAEDRDLQETAPNSGEFIDRKMYGSLHNYGHDKFAEIGYIPIKNRLGVMSSNIVSPRDPCFWLWHRHIDDFRQVIVKKYKHDLNKFKPKAMIKSLKIKLQNPSSMIPLGGIATYLGPPHLEKNECNAKLGHEPYQWEITVASTRNHPPDHQNLQQFTIRLFIAPAVLIQDNRAWIEMDKFTHKLCKLEEEIVRKDTESSVARKTIQPGDNPPSRCLCGWPQNMMVPIGKPDGMPYVAFAMLTDDFLGENMTQSLSFCGAQDEKYPDPRGMGYPFNKTWKTREDTTASVRSIIDGLPHTKLYDFTIYRYTKFFQGSTPPPEPDKITWNNTIKDFFTGADVKCMKSTFDLRSQADVTVNAGRILDAVESGRMPLGETQWNDEKVQKFKIWMEAGCP